MPYRYKKLTPPEPEEESPPSKDTGDSVEAYLAILFVALVALLFLTAIAGLLTPKATRRCWSQVDAGYHCQ